MDFCVFCGIPCYPMARLVDHGIFIVLAIDLAFFGSTQRYRLTALKTSRA